MKRAATNTHTVYWCIVIGCSLFLVSGCGSKSVDAQPRNSSYQPVYSVEEAVAKVTRLNSFDLSFLHDDLFACFTVDVESVISNTELTDVPWDSLEERLAKLIGPDNSQLKNIERAWVLMDRDSLSFEFNGPQESPLVFVVDFKKIPNEKQLERYPEPSPLDGDSAGTSETDSDSKVVVRKIGDTRVVIGSEKLTAKFSTSNAESSLSRLMKEMKLDSDVDGLIDMRPIRSLLQRLFDMAGTLGGESAAKFARLPEVTQRAEMSLSLSSDEMFQAVVHIDDDDLTREIANLTKEAANSNGSTSGAQGMIPFGLGAVGDETNMMITPTSTEWLAAVGQQITEDGLFSVDGKDRKVTFSLSRPDKIKELIGAALTDVKNQVTLATRTTNMDTIAKAMQAYHEKHSVLPPAGVVVGNSDARPDQFNWRVGLLPFLGEDELHQKFDFSQSWDSPTNLDVAKQMPGVFADDSLEDQSTTRLHVVGGKLGLYNDEGAPVLDDIADKKIWTAVVIEGATESAVVWTKPGPLNIDDPDMDQFGNAGENGILFFNAAFDTRIIGKDQENVRGILTPDGDEQLIRKDFLPLVPGR